MESTRCSKTVIKTRHRLHASSVLSMLGLTAMAGCSEPKITPIPPPVIEPPTCTSTVVTEKLTQSSIDKVDILLALDNSRSMADKQQILALAVPDLVRSIVNPRCVDANGMAVPAQPLYPLDNCAAGSTREFAPILDVHIGVISSSIGGHGADSCPDIDTMSKECQPLSNTTNNDRGRLLSRLDQCGTTKAPTYANKGFLAWDPRQEAVPPGETVIDNGMGGGIVPTLRDMVLGAGQIGCGYESQLESIYRFLADPNPYETISVENFKATPMGTDQVLLDQRRNFMRPDSLLTIIMLTDENDCSIKEFGQFYYVGQLRNGATPVRLPRARQECAINPNDPCCKSCGQSAGSCPADPTCKDPNGGTGPALLTEQEDDINLRCWNQKRRFGIDFLYPTDRYVQAFTSAQIADRDGNIVDNPIFSDLNPNDTNSNVRDPGFVFFAGIVGVPWQDIARDKNDLKKGFKDATEMLQPIDAGGFNTWDVVLGDPANNVKPKDPLMIDTYEKRTGTNPITGDPIVDATTPLSNSINGHEWTISNDDLQYACIFPLLAGTERDCTNANLTGCDCPPSPNIDTDNPLCQKDPNNMDKPTLQVRAKGYPGIRHLQVLRDLGSQGIVASVCPAQLSDPSETSTDFGYRPAIGAITDRLKTAVGGQCLTQTLEVQDGRTTCMLIEASNSGGQCSCDPSLARRDIIAGTDADQAMKQAQQHPLAVPSGWDCYCEMAQLKGEELTACQNDISETPVVNGQKVSGWCYVAVSPVQVGNPQLLAKCPDNEKRDLRFLGAGKTRDGATLFVSCQTGPSCNP